MRNRALVSVATPSKMEQERRWRFSRSSTKGRPRSGMGSTRRLRSFQSSQNDIQALKSAVVDIRLRCNSQNESGNISSDITTHSTRVVDNLKNRLVSTTKEFTEVLSMQTENLKVHENRRQLFSSTASKDSPNPFAWQCPLSSKAASGPSKNAPPPWVNGSQLLRSKQTDTDSQPLLQHQRQQQQQMVPHFH